MLRHSEDRYPVILISCALILSLLPFIFDSQIALFFAIISLFFRFLAPIHQHSHGHLSIFKEGFYNKIYDIILMCAGGYTTPMWKIHHNIGHHNDFLDPSRDYQGNDRFGRNIPFKRFIFTFFGDAMTIIDSFQILRIKKLSKSKLKKQFVIQLMIQLSLYSLLMIANWKLFLIFIYLPNRIYRWSIFWFSFGQHENMPMENVFSSSQTKLVSNRYILNVGFHTAHHHRPGLHWSKLAEHTYSILDKIPTKCLKGAMVNIGLPENKIIP